MERTIISWNIPNWITVVLMATAGFLIIGVVSQVLMNKFGSNGPTEVGSNAAQY